LAETDCVTGRFSCVCVLAIAAAVGVAACKSVHELPPLGEALLIVDTDASVPLLASRLRVDAFTTSKQWYSTQDFELSDPTDWPASFGVYSPDPDAGKTVVLRLRAYAAGNVRDYRGERYATRASGANPSAETPVPPPTPGEAPRLIDAHGADVTPPTEPQPLLAIDRLLLVTVSPGKVESVRVVLRGACFGTMADLATFKTCTDTENVIEPLAASSPSSDLSIPTSSLEGTFGVDEGCTSPSRPAGTSPDGTPLYDEEGCVRGGAFIFGSEALAGNGVGTSTPERIAIIPSFRMDRYEVTVARWRDGLTKGFVSKTGLPAPNDGPFPKNPAPDDIYATEFCTFSATPLGRESFPVTCIDWRTARAFCQFEGGDLLAESQWEYAAEMSGRSVKTAFPWGGPDDMDPVCAQAVSGRAFDGTLDVDMIGACVSSGFGPLGEDAALYGSGHAPAGVLGNGDATIGLGIANLGANVSEWVLDTAYSMGSNCWMSQPLTLPACQDPLGTNLSVRGSSWDLPGYDTFSGYRLYSPNDTFETNEGFRCARPGGS
jgi:formylglycine-generating enzyme required for sulfatase activity